MFAAGRTDVYNGDATRRYVSVRRLTQEALLFLAASQ
jgi:hypothetical protein